LSRVSKDYCPGVDGQELEATVDLWQKMEQDWNWCFLIKFLSQIRKCIQCDVHGQWEVVYSLSHMDKESKKA
jgi:hypothetical protein